MEFCAHVSLLGKQGGSENTHLHVHSTTMPTEVGKKVCVGEAELFRLSIGVVDICNHHGLEFDVEVDN